MPICDNRFYKLMFIPECKYEMMDFTKVDFPDPDSARKAIFSKKGISLHFLKFY